MLGDEVKKKVVLGTKNQDKLRELQALLKNSKISVLSLKHFPARPDVIENGKTVKMYYELTVDGDVIDSTDGREPFQYTHGKNEIIPALERQLEGLDVGDEREIILGPEDAYGVIDQDAFVEVPKSQLPQEDIQVGTRFGMIGPDGLSLPATVVEIRSETVILDLNHPLAGKELHFAVQIIEISSAD